MNEKAKIGFRYAFLIILGLVMIFPLIWLISASFKTNEEIFGSLSLLPKKFILSSYVNGWKGGGQYSFTTFFKNTLVLVIPTILFTVLSSTIVAYGFARFNFVLKRLLFSLMISTLMLPNTVIIIPRYILFKNLNWNNSYYPFWIPALLGCYPFFIYMMIQFFRGLPRALDESAYIDGCNSFFILVRIMVPLCKPAIISMGLFQLIWTWNDFFNSLIYISSVKKYTVILALKMSLDNEAAVNWNQVMAMSFVTIIPLILVFFFSQKYFVEGIATTGLKG